MFSRLSKFALLYIPGGVVIGYFLIEAEDQRPWLIALAVYFLVMAVIGNVYVFFGGGRKK